MPEYLLWRPAPKVRIVALAANEAEATELCAAGQMELLLAEESAAQALVAAIGAR